MKSRAAPGRPAPASRIELGLLDTSRVQGLQAPAVQQKILAPQNSRHQVSRKGPFPRQEAELSGSSVSSIYGLMCSSSLSGPGADPQAGSHPMLQILKSPRFLTDILGPKKQNPPGGLSSPFLLIHKVLKFKEPSRDSSIHAHTFSTFPHCTRPHLVCFPAGHSSAPCRTGLGLSSGTNCSDM